MTPLTFNIRRGVTFGPVSITCRDAAGVAVPLAGWSAFAEARQTPQGPVILNLAPVIQALDAVGLITIPAISYAATKALVDGVCAFDLILHTPTGTRIESGIQGTIHISTPLTQP